MNYCKGADIQEQPKLHQGVAAVVHTMNHCHLHLLQVDG